MDLIIHISCPGTGQFPVQTQGLLSQSAKARVPETPSKLMLIPGTGVCTSTIIQVHNVDSIGHTGISRHLSKGRDDHDELQSSKIVDCLALFPGQVWGGRGPVQRGHIYPPRTHHELVSWGSLHFWGTMLLSLSLKPWDRLVLACSCMHKANRSMWPWTVAVWGYVVLEGCSVTFLGARVTLVFIQKAFHVDRACWANRGYISRVK